MLKLPLLLLHIFVEYATNEDLKIIPRLLNRWAPQSKPSIHKEEKIFWGKDADANTAPYQVLTCFLSKLLDLVNLSQSEMLTFSVDVFL